MQIHTYMYRHTYMYMYKSTYIHILSGIVLNGVTSPADGRTQQNCNTLQHAATHCNTMTPMACLLRKSHRHT